MKRKHIFRAIALILSVSLMANTIPAYALPQTTEESDGFQMPEGIPLLWSRRLWNQSPMNHRFWKRWKTGGK